MILLDTMLSLYSGLERQLHSAYQQEYQLGRDRNRDRKIVNEELGLVGYASLYTTMTEWDDSFKSHRTVTYLVVHAADLEIRQRADTKMRPPVDFLDDCEYCWWGLYLSALCYIGDLTPDVTLLLHLVPPDRAKLEIPVKPAIGKLLVTHYQQHFRAQVEENARQAEARLAAIPKPFEQTPAMLPQLPLLPPPNE